MAAIAIQMHETEYLPPRDIHSDYLAQCFAGGRRESVPASCAQRLKDGRVIARTTPASGAAKTTFTSRATKTATPSQAAASS